MADQNQEITIVIKGSNVSTPAFQQAAADALGLSKNVGLAGDKAKAAAGGYKSYLDSLTGIPGAGGAATAAIGAFGVTLAASTAIGFAKSMLSDADALMRMSDVTGVSLQGLQKFQIAADDAGNSVDDITGAITKMEDKLASGDKTALAALDRLKLPFEDIKNLKPENQFIAISDAIRQVKDPAQQVSIAIDLFGKQGASVLPTLKRGFDDLKDGAVGMSDETIRAMDEAGDTIARWSRLAKGYAAEATVGFVHFVTDGITPAQRAASALSREMKESADQLHRLIESLPGAKQNLPAPLSVPKSDSAEVKAAEKALDDAERKRAAAAEKAQADAKRLAEQLYEVERAGYRDSVAMRIMADNLTDIGTRDDSVLQLKKNFDDLDDSIRKDAASIHELTLEWPSDVATLNANLGGNIIPSTLTVSPFGQLMPQLKGIQQETKSWRGDLEGIASAFAQFAQVSDGALGKAAREIGGLVTGTHLAGTAIGQMSDHFEMIDGKLTTIHASFTNVTAGMMTFFGLALQYGPKVADALGKVFDHGTSTWGAVNKQLDEIMRKVKAYQDATKEVDDAVSAAGFKTHDQLMHEADIANQVYEKIKKGFESGQYTAEQVTEAYRHYQEALAAMGDEAAKAWLKAQDAAKAAGDEAQKATDARMTAAENELKGMIDRRDQLQKGLDAEQDEAVKGVIQTRDEAELAALDDKIQQKADQYAQLAKETGQEMADAIREALERLHVNIDVGYNLHGGGFTPSNGNTGVAGGVDRWPVIPDGLTYDDYVRDYWAPDRDAVLQNFPGHATGGVFDREHLARIAEGNQPEMVGSVDFISRAMTAALARLNRIPSPSSAPITMPVHITATGADLDDVSRFIPKLNDAIRRNTGGIYDVIQTVASRVGR